MSALLSWLFGGGISAITGSLERAYKARLAAQTDAEKLHWDAQIRFLEAELSIAQNGKEVRVATAGFWEMRLITFVIAACFTLHLVLVTLDTCFSLGWKIPAYPKPFDEWQGAILLSFFGIYTIGKGVSAIASAISRRRK